MGQRRQGRRDSGRQVSDPNPNPNSNPDPNPNPNPSPTRTRTRTLAPTLTARRTLAEIHFSKPVDKRLPDLRNVKLGYSEGEEEQRLQTMPPQVTGR